MNKVTKRWVAAIIAIAVILFIAASTVAIIVISNEDKTTTTETTTATVTDATTEETTTEEATTEEVKVPSAKVILDNRKADKPAASNKTKFDASLDYVIEKDTDKCTVRSTDKKETVKWYAAKTNDTIYVVEDTYLRIVPNTKVLGTDLFFGTKVKRIGVSENGWDIISYKNKFYFIWYEELIDKDPSSTTAEVATTEAPKTTSAPTTTEVATTEAPATTEIIVDIVEATIETNTVAEVPTEVTEASTEEAVTEAPALTAVCNPWDLYVNTINYNGYIWTWYTEVLLPGEGLPIPGRYTDGDGFVCDENGYIVLAAHLDQVSRYTIMETPFGRLGKVYDTGCNYGVIDVYTNWQPY